jgi:tetratricopeptide (TPR) repeat protein
MLVVFPNSLQYDTNHIPTFYEDHLLERVTTLELQLGQTVEKLESAYQFINRCLELFEKDHIILQSFLETVNELNPELTETLSRRNVEIYRGLRETKTAKTTKKRTLSLIQAQHDNPNAELFTSLVKKGIDLLAQNEEKEAFQMLERAALLSTQNATLFLFIAENYFTADKFDKARKYLEKAFEIEPTNSDILLLLGAVLADNAEIVNARRWLSVVVHHDKKSFAVNYIWGMSAAYESNWSEALAAFKQALEKEKNAEIEYLIGCVYFQMKREKLALRHFQKATEIDSKFSDAFFMQSLLFKKSKDAESAEKTQQKASETKENGAQCLGYLNKVKPAEPKVALPFAHFSKKSSKILTGGSLRLNRFYKSRILKAIE